MVSINLIARHSCTLHYSYMSSSPNRFIFNLSSFFVYLTGALFFLSFSSLADLKFVWEKLFYSILPDGIQTPYQFYDTNRKHTDWYCLPTISVTIKYESYIAL